MSRLQLIIISTFTILTGTLLATNYLYTDDFSVEVGVSSLSPLGEAGGRAVPASGCSDLHDSDCNDPTITTSKTFTRIGDDVEICWNPDNHTACTLSDNLTGDPNVIACDTQNIPTHGTRTFTITCTDGAFGESSVNVNTIPVIFES